MIAPVAVRASRAFAAAFAATVLLGCASVLQSDPVPILEGSWDMLATIDGVDYAGHLTFSPDGLVIWDGDRGERNVCEATPRARGGGYTVPCPVYMDLVPNDDGELVATVRETRRSEGYRRRCLSWEERSARMVCAEWETTPQEQTERVQRRIVLVPEEGATVRWTGGLP